MQYICFDCDKVLTWSKCRSPLKQKNSKGERRKKGLTRENNRLYWIKFFVSVKVSGDIDDDELQVSVVCFLGVVNKCGDSGLIVNRYNS